jgi:adenine deaminase
MASPDTWYLSEVMNYPGVLNHDPEIEAKIKAAKETGKPVDGHAPGLKGPLAKKYAEAGITTDHESFTLEEALDKVQHGMHCLIREGSAAKNFDALIDIIRTNPEKVMFCSDDKHPDELVLHHINNHVKRALKLEHDLFDVLRAASVNPVLHYKLTVGLLRSGDPADFIVVDNLKDFNILKTYINGQLVADNRTTLLPPVVVDPINNFNAVPTSPQDFVLRTEKDKPVIRVIEACEGQLITKECHLPGKVENGYLVSDTENDILKLVVINRYAPGIPPAIAFIRNFGLRVGAIASTVAHDCHNIIAVGVDDESLSAAVNSLIEVKGGISVASDKGTVDCLPLPVAGLMSIEDGYIVAEQYASIDKKAKSLGTPLKSPFMTLSFMALLVIPALKLSDQGLFNGSEFRFTDVEV